MMSVQVAVATETESNHQVAAVVATHKHCYPLERCLESVQSMLSHPRDLIFVDNGSSERLNSWVTDKFPDISLLRLEDNRLFCGGYNAGIRLAVKRGYDFVLIVNADTQVINGSFLSGLVDAARRWPRAAFIGPLVYYRSPSVHQKTCLSFPSVLRSLLIWLPWRLAQNQFTTQPTREQEVQFLNGVCVLCRASALRDIGLMDETFGGYVEDADWSFRARSKGWVSVFTPVPSVTHYEDEAGYEAYSLKTFMLKRNTVLWFLKAGYKRSARFYALTSILLAKVRIITAGSEIERESHRQFYVLLKRAYHGLLRGDAPGEWFGPPLAPWSGARNA